MRTQTYMNCKVIRMTKYLFFFGSFDFVVIEAATFGFITETTFEPREYL